MPMNNLLKYLFNIFTTQFCLLFSHLSLTRGLTIEDFWGFQVGILDESNFLSQADINSESYNPFSNESNWPHMMVRIVESWGIWA